MNWPQDARIFLSRVIELKKSVKLTMPLTIIKLKNAFKCTK